MAAACNPWAHLAVSPPGLPGLPLQSPGSCRGLGVPSCWDSQWVGRNEATTEGASLSSEKLPVTLDHDPDHAVLGKGARDPHRSWHYSPQHAVPMAQPRRERRAACRDL